MALSKGGHFRVKIRLDTPRDLLERVENARNGATVVHLALRPELTVIPLKGLNWLRPEPTNLGAHTVSIPRDEWHRILSEIGFRDVLIFEFGAEELAASDPNLRAALDEVAKARRAYDDNQTDGVAQHAYRALEALASKHGSTGSLAERIAKAYLAGAHKEIQTRMERALAGILPSYHVGRHLVGEGDAPRVEVSRPHAKWILGTAQLVIGWCATARPAGA